MSKRFFDSAAASYDQPRAALTVSHVPSGGTKLGTFEIVRLLGAWVPGELGPHRLARFAPGSACRLGTQSSEHLPPSTPLTATDGQRYNAMEYVDGETLDDRLIAAHLPLREALDIAIQIAAALTAAHGAGIVHRDIKPANVNPKRSLGSCIAAAGACGAVR